MPTNAGKESERLDPRVVRTRKLLREAFMALLKEKPYDRITIADITQRATVNRKTFYLHHETKDHLLQSVTDDILDDLFGEAKEAQPGDLSIDEQQAYIAGRIFAYVKKHRAFFEIMFERKAMTDFVQYMKRYFARFYEEKFANLDESRLPVQKDVIASYIGSAYVGVIHGWLNDGMRQTPEEMTRQMILLNLQGPIQTVKNSQ
ncbi:TetR/AcrR family transcriptional regulator [Saccharibacillus alkalitolerans]|uniref:TetR/AcrR family transcriptional regulator n=1 Tax=Saccharibacillus alkalitolerans TaxID=2705290 RepID=A0ABX0F471_9BACL|nr:TetR/AcrR family transcriptional regulator C-terminal domain-containing protein [Saccharibacillus alkalitolerans]NGZ74704.1 TetR/AcrR family transcriptional regulator [Saccharibacillus alkalitolerans]